MGTVVDLDDWRDTRWWPAAQQAWGQGSASASPEGAGPLTLDTWRASMRRLAARLGCPVRTGTRDGHAWAVANAGYPLGITDENDRIAWNDTCARRGNS